ncbi:MAG: c-type cytochrome [Chitinophagaceae bacterium]|nr:c-type cytochrome [Chitinophagaceae bacterium]MCW5929566.1 c-type cytochrome [Chitinophagaceae bacterium]
MKRLTDIVKQSKFCNLIIGGFIFQQLLLTGCHNNRTTPIEFNDFDSLKLGDFVERDFPFYSTTLDARNLGDEYPKDNLVARGLMVQLGNNIYGCFDMDLLRWSLGFETGTLPVGQLSQVSYHDFFNKANEVPKIRGNVIFANGIYPGGSINQTIYEEVRSEDQCRSGFCWGAIPSSYGRWEGIYILGKQAILSYSIGSVSIHEIPGSILSGFGAIFTRTVTVDSSPYPVYLNAAEVCGKETFVSDKGDLAYVRDEVSDSITAIAIKSINEDPISVISEKDKYLSVKFSPGSSYRSATIFLWKGLLSNLQDFKAKVAGFKKEKTLIFDNGGPKRWNYEVVTKGRLSPDTAAFVIDNLTLPLPNPWHRNMRPMDIAFFPNSENKAAVVTYSGDVWIVEGISAKLEKLMWKRYASGLFEPMSIAIRDNQIFVYDRNGIIELRDLNGDGEADFYKNFSNIMDQSIESREWPSDMVLAEDGSFFISKGGAGLGGQGVTPLVTTGFRAGSNQSGTIMHISQDGRQSKIIATGLRDPYLGLRKTDNFLTATDQEGNFVPSTPIYIVKPGNYFGVPATKHRTDSAMTERPLTWIPHEIDRSASSELWVTGNKMGPLDNALLHFSFGRPGIFRVLIDTTKNGLIGGVTFIPANYVAPTMKGAIGSDGQLYIAGMNLFGSNSVNIAAIQRLRYTGEPSLLLKGFQAGKEGIILAFDSELDPESAKDVTNYAIKRWDYKRTEKYGSGHFKPDGTPGEEKLPALAAYLSPTGKEVLLLVPDMKEIDQVEVRYNLISKGNKPLHNGLWFSLYNLNHLSISNNDFKNIDFNLLNISDKELAKMVQTDLPVTVDRGKILFNEKGCSGCHSTGMKTDGMYGPPFQGIYGSKQVMTDGITVAVDEEYLKESILHPNAKIVKGYQAEMPSYEGVLTNSELESIISYIKALYRP